MKHDKPSLVRSQAPAETSSCPELNAGQGFRARLPVLMAALFPLALDIVTGGALLTSVLGAALWGLLILVSVLEPRTQDTRLRKLLRSARVCLWGMWLAVWLISTFVHLQSSPAFLRPLSQLWLVRVHAFLLAGASGLVLLFGVASMAALFQMKRLRRSSWSRRTSSFQLPSIESLSRVSSSAVFWAFSCWGIGLSLAALTLLVAVDARNAESRSLGVLLADPKILLTCFLWLILGLAFLIQTRTRMLSTTRAYWLASLSAAFWIFLSMQTWLQTSSFHEPLRWFIR